MHLFIWGHIFCNLGFFYTVLHFVWHFLWINVIFADRANGHQRTGSCIYEFISTFYLLCDHLAAADQAKLLCPKKKKCSMNRDIPSYFVSVFGLK